MTVSREQLLTEVWGYDLVGETRVMDVKISGLRRKLDLGEQIKSIPIDADFVGAFQQDRDIGTQRVSEFIEKTLAATVTFEHIAGLPQNAGQPDCGRKR